MDSSTPEPQADLTDVTVEVTETILDAPVSKDDAWMESQHGVVGQFVEAPSPLTPINPLADTEPGTGNKNVSHDTVTERPMGLRLIRFEF